LLSEALRQRRYDRLAYFAFDLLHLDGLDRRSCPLEDRKALLRNVVDAVDHLVGSGQQLFAAVRLLGAEGIVSKTRRQPLSRRDEPRLAQDQGQRDRRVCDHRVGSARVQGRRASRGKTRADPPASPRSGCWCPPEP
jgi:hypothetical protein